MSQQPELLTRIAEALSQGAAPFRAENEAYSSFADVPVVDQLSPRHQLKQGILVDHQANSGTLVSAGHDEASDGLRLTLEDRGTASWLTMNLRLDTATLREGRYLGVLIDLVSTGFVSFRICLRSERPDGLSDQFFREVAVFGGGPSEQLFFLPLDQARIADATKTEILFFFDGRSFDTTFRKIESILVK